MRETRVNLKHLLEDIRDSYSVTIEEVILLELIANALDSGASRIDFFIDSQNNSLTAIDNGSGMKRKQLADYHNIAATTKIRGKGIGFAGVGAKLSLLVSEKVVTETKGGRGSRSATEWYLKNETSAPWKFVPFSEKVLTSRGTAISIFLRNPQSPLLFKEFIIKTTESHFYPLLRQDLFAPILKHIYKKGVEFFVNGKKVFIVNTGSENFLPKVFQIRLGGRNRRLAGTGFLAKQESETAGEEKFGLAISTYGKIIKSGWEWLGVNLREEEKIFGIVEIPELSEILTTNKNDFLKDSASLKKYYQYRKAIQEAVSPFLKEFSGDLGTQLSQKQYKLLSRDIENTIKNILKNFPELTPLLGVKASKQKNNNFKEIIESQLVSIIENDLTLDRHNQKNENTAEESKNINSNGKETKNISGESGAESGRKPALVIGFESRTVKDQMARMMENKIWINNSHPAYVKAREENLDSYHIVFCVALTLSSFLEDTHLPQEFINYFLASWGSWDNKGKKTTNLFKIKNL